MPIRPAAAALLLLCALAAAPAGAGAADPWPVPCNGMHLEDEPADGAYEPRGFLGDLEGEQPGRAPANLEVVGAFLNYRPGSDGAKVLTANIVIANLDRTLPDGAAASGGVWYYAYWRHGEAVRFVRAANADGSTIVYKYGTVSSGGPLGSAYRTDGDTTGTFSEGPNGVVSIAIPEAIGGRGGDTLAGFGVTAETIEGLNDGAGINHQADTAPDAFEIAAPNGRDYLVAECPPAQPHGAPAGAAGPSPAASGSAPAGPGSSGGPGPAASPPAPLPLRVASSLGSARKAARKRALALKVSASKAIADLRITISPERRGRAVATGRIASLRPGRRTIRLKTSKSVRKGRHLLTATGVVDGRRQSVTRVVRFRR